MIDFSSYSFIVAICLIWLATIVYVARLCVRVPGQSAGLPAAFCFATTFLYLGAFTFVVPGYSHERLDAHFYLAGFGVGHESIANGALLTCMALISFAIGTRLTMARQSNSGAPIAASPFEPPYKLAMLAIAGLAVLGVLIPLLGLRFPLSQAVEIVGRNASLALVCIGLFKARIANDQRGKIIWYAAAAAQPTYYLIVFGFVSYGFIASTIILFFIVASSTRRQWTFLRLVAASVVLAYFLASLFVLYFSFRDELRSVIWSGASFAQRFALVADVLSEVKLINPFDFDSLDLINVRLSQTAFVGRMLDWHAEYPDLRQYGASLFLFVFAWVPRFLWPGKPTMGSSSILEENTGLIFSKSATFGAGQVIEFYVNFGTIGVIVGFFILGIVLARIDRRAIIALQQGAVLSFAKFFVIGICIIAPLTDLFFLVNGAIMSWILFSLIQFGLARRVRRQMVHHGAYGPVFR